MAKTQMTLSAVETEILKATEAKPRGKKEPEQKYRARLARSVDEWCKAAGSSQAADDRWDGLSAEAQSWMESAATAVNDKTDIPEFPGSEDTSSEDNATQPPEGKEKPMKKSKEKGEKAPKEKVAKAPKEKVAKAKKEKAPKAPRGPGKHSIFRKRVIEGFIKGGGKTKFAPVYDAYVEKVGEAEAITRPSASVVASNTIQTLQILDEMGLLNKS